MTFQIENHTGILIKKAARLFEQVANNDLDKLGVTYAQTIFLIRLWEKDGQSQIELAKSAGLKQPTVVRMLDRMERDELVKRVRNKEDRRVFNFYLTPKAKKACQKLEAHADTMNKISSESIPKKEIEKLNQLISTVIENLQQFLDKI
ncbi:MAG: MarR family transcriptional regulator [Gammaproteobacteria bacterium]